MSYRFTSRLLRTLAALLLGISLLTPYLYGFADGSGDECACCAKGSKGKLCCRRLKTHGHGPAFSRSSCPQGCAQSPALPVAAPALLSATSASCRFTSAPARLFPSPRSSHFERIALFALFQRPPPSL